MVAQQIRHGLRTLREHWICTEVFLVLYRSLPNHTLEAFGGIPLHFWGDMTTVLEDCIKMKLMFISANNLGSNHDWAFLVYT